MTWPSAACAASLTSLGNDSRCSCTLPSRRRWRVTAAIDTTRHTMVFRNGIGSSSLAPACCHMCSITSRSGMAAGSLYSARPAAGSGTHSQSKAHTLSNTLLNMNHLAP